MAIAAAGQDPGTWTAAGSGFSPLDFLARVTPRLQSATDWERQLLAVTAAHRNPTQFGGADLVAQVRSFYAQGQFGGTGLLNDDVFAILSLAAAGAGAQDPQLQSSLQFLLLHQGADGGWSYQAGGLSDVDDTASALMALHAMDVPASAAAVQSAFTYLHAQQLPDGGLPSIVHGGSVSNTASDAWAASALWQYGEDPSGPSWAAPGGATIVSNLLSFQQADGSFQWDLHQRVGPTWMTAYAIPALVGQAYPVA
jgi:hypothetical protein